MNLIYTGIGSRQTPESVVSRMKEIAKRLALYGYTLRSGGAEGADTAFESGARRTEIYLPWKGFNDHTSELHEVEHQAIKKAMDIHPAPHKLSDGVKKLHGRNVYQVLGKGMNNPSEFVVFWAPEKNGKVEGGTATAVNLARAEGIPTFNLYSEEDSHRFDMFMGQKYKEFIIRYCRHIYFFYPEAIEEKDDARFEVLLKKDNPNNQDTTEILSLFKKYWGTHSDRRYLPTDIEDFKKRR